MSVSSSSASCSTSSNGVLDSIVSLLLQSVLVSQCNIVSPDSYPMDFSSEALAHGLDDIDFIVIGAGSAGSVMASRLSENPDWNVLIVEAGGDPPVESEIPALSNTLLSTEKTYDYLTEPNHRSCNAFRDNRCFISAGKNIGGSSQLDNMSYLIGNPRDYDRLCKAGNFGWCYSDVKPYFEKSLMPQGNATHPKGFLQISQFEQYDDIYSQLLWNAVQEAGQPIVRDFIDDTYLGYSFVRGFVENGRRSSPAKVFLGKVAGRPNLKVMKNTLISKMIHDHSCHKIKSIELVVDQKHVLKVNVKKEIILAAGTMETPKILMLSGIGPKCILEPLNIPTKHELPVGEGLKDVVMSPVFIKLSPKASGQLEKEVYNFLVNNEGPLRSNGISSFVGFIKSERRNSTYPDMQLEHKLFQQNDIFFKRYLNGLAIKDELLIPLMEAIKTNDVLVISVNLLNPYSMGRLTLKSSAFLDVPVIDTNYLKDRRDVATLAEGMHFVDQLLGTSSMLRQNAEFIRLPLPECELSVFRSKSYWKCYMKYFSTSGYSPVGTAKMGAKYDTTAVVTPRLLVKGMTNLRVVDQSVLTSPPSATSSAPSVMIAEKAADYIKQDYSYKEHDVVKK